MRICGCSILAIKKSSDLCQPAALTGGKVWRRKDMGCLIVRGGNVIEGSELTLDCISAIKGKDTLFEICCGGMSLQLSDVVVPVVDEYELS